MWRRTQLDLQGEITLNHWTDKTFCVSHSFLFSISNALNNFIHLFIEQSLGHVFFSWRSSASSCSCKASLILVRCYCSNKRCCRCTLASSWKYFLQPFGTGLGAVRTIFLHGVFHGWTAIVGLGLQMFQVSRSHPDTLHSVWLLWTRDQPFAETSTWQHTNIHASFGIRNRNLSKRGILGLRLRPCWHLDRPLSELEIYTPTFCAVAGIETLPRMSFDCMQYMQVRNTVYSQI